MSNIMRSVLEGLFPQGSLWDQKSGGGFDLFLQGQAENLNDVRIFLASLADIRNPFLVQISLLPDLEKEYGISLNPALSEAVRRSNLAAVMFAAGANGSDNFLERQLVAAGFAVQVHENDPAVDPRPFLENDFRMVCDGFNAFAGRIDAFARRVGGIVLVNGDLFTQHPDYLMQCSGGSAFAANEKAVCGQFDEVAREELEYFISADPATWPFVFFVGGDATRNGVTDAIESIDRADVAANRKQEFERLILKYKPMSTWCVYFINFI